MKDFSKIYIDILEVGNKYLESGISYNEMLQHFSIEKDFHLINLPDEPLKEWFFDNFYCEKVENYKTAVVGNSNIKMLKVYNNNLDENAYLKGSALFRLIDYYELRDARKSSKQAHTIAIIAILISAVFALIQICN